MSELKIKELLSQDVALIKEKLGLESYTWGEHNDKLKEALLSDSDVLKSFISDGGNAAYVSAAVKDITTIRGYAFGYCSTLQTVYFPSVTSIGTGAFTSCSNLKTVNFPVATDIGSSAFSFCNKLTSVYFPVVTNVGKEAFCGCSNLETADFPVATSIKSQAFYMCKTLSRVYLRNAETVCTLASKNAFEGANNAYIYVPSALVDSYKTATNWTNYADRILPIPIEPS